MLVGPVFAAPFLPSLLLLPRLLRRYGHASRHVVRIRSRICVQFYLLKLPPLYIFVSASQCASVAGDNEGVPNPAPAGLSAALNILVPALNSLVCPCPCQLFLLFDVTAARSKACIARSAGGLHFRFLIPCLVSSTASTYCANFLTHRTKCPALPYASPDPAIHHSTRSRM